MSVITLTGPTCSGKTSLEAALQRCGLGRAISHTTRQRRSNEADGVAYHFVSDEEYARLDRTGAFIETVEFGSSRYAMSGGSLWDAMKDTKHVVIVAEPHGARQIHEFCARENIKSHAFWVDCSVKTQARRWVARLMTDMVAGKNIIGPYSERLTAMLGEESTWRVLNSKSDNITAATHLEYELSLDSEQNSAEELACVVMRQIT